MRSQFFFDFLCASLLLGNVELQELYVVRNRGGALAFGAKIVETQSCLDRTVDNVLGLQCTSLVKEIPFVVVFAAVFGGRVEENVVVE